MTRFCKQVARSLMPGNVTGQILLFLLLSLTSLSAFPVNAETLTEFNMQLEAQRFRPFNVTMSGSQSLVKLPNQNWQFQLVADGSWAGIDETSEFAMADGEVVPVHFKSDSHFGFFSEKKEITFDHQLQKALVIVDKDSRTVDLEPQVFDPHSYQIYLANQIQAGKKTIEFKVIRYKRPLIYRYQVIGDDTVQTSAGKLATVKVKQIHGIDEKEDQYVWLAKDFGYIPVQYEHYRKNKIVDRIRMVSGTFNSKPITGNN